MKRGHVAGLLCQLDVLADCLEACGAGRDWHRTMNVHPSPGCVIGAISDMLGALAVTPPSKEVESARRYAWWIKMQCLAVERGEGVEA